MAYQTASADNIADLLSKLVNFATTNGWTVLKNGFRYNNPTWKWVALQKGTCTFGLFEDNSGLTNQDYTGPHILQTIYDGFDPDAHYDNQVNASANVQTNFLVGPFQAYHFFSGDGLNGPYLHVVVETSAGTFKHFGAGTIDKQGAVNTGTYIHGSLWNMTYQVNSTNYRGDPNSSQNSYPWDDYGSNPTTIVRADRDAAAPNYANALNNNRTLRTGFRYNDSWGYPFIASSPADTTGVDPLVHIISDVSRPSGFRSIIGEPPDMRFVNVTNFNAGQHDTLGGDEWIIFPAHRKNGVVGEVNSGVYGFAYKVVP